MSNLISYIPYAEKQARKTYHESVDDLREFGSLQHKVDLIKERIKENQNKIEKELRPFKDIIWCLMPGDIFSFLGRLWNWKACKKAESILAKQAKLDSIEQAVMRVDTKIKSAGPDYDRLVNACASLPKISQLFQSAPVFNPPSTIVIAEQPRPVAQPAIEKPTERDSENESSWKTLWNKVCSFF